MAAKPIVEFLVVHNSLEIKFRTNSETKLSKVWDSYVQSRKWSPSEKCRYRLFLDNSEGVHLSGTVQSNNIADGKKLMVYELELDELVDLVFSDQYGNEVTFTAWQEDDLEYWVDAFRSHMSGAKGSAPRPSEQYTLYDCTTHTKVDMLQQPSPTLEPYIVQTGGEESVGSTARFLCFRYTARPRPCPMTLTFFLYHGGCIHLEVEADTPLAEAVQAVTIMDYTVHSLQLLGPGSVALFKGWRMLEYLGMRAGDLLARSSASASGLLLDDDVEAEDEEPEGRRVDVDYMCNLSTGGSLQLAAWNGCSADHPTLKALRPESFSDQAAGPLFLAAFSGALGSVDALLDWGADPMAGNCGGVSSAELAAAVSGHTEVLKLMLQRRGEQMVAEAHRLAAVGKQLQQAALEVGGSRALSLGCYCACQSVCTRKLILLTEPSARENSLVYQLAAVPLLVAARAGHAGVVAAMLEAGYPADVQDSSGDSALTAAASHGHPEVVKLLLAAGAAANHRSLDGEQPIHAAASSGSVECVQALLAAGAEPDAQADLLLSYDEVVRVSGRKMRLPSELGEWFRRQPRQSREAMLDHAGIMGGCTPLSLAVRVGHRDVVVLLLEALGCSGKQPLTKARADMIQGLLGLASSQGDRATAALLLERLTVCGAGAGAANALTDGSSSANESTGSRAAAGVGSRARKAINRTSRSAAAAAAGSRGAAKAAAEAAKAAAAAVEAEAEAAAGAAAAGQEADGMFNEPEGLVRSGAVREALAGLPALPQAKPPPAAKALALPPPPTATTLPSNRAARKAAAREARAGQAAAAQRHRHHEDEERRQSQRQEERVAEHAGVQLRNYILQERQELRRKMGLDQDVASVEAAAASSSSAAATAAGPAGDAGPGAAADGTSGSETLCRCCLRRNALDGSLVAAAGATEPLPEGGGGVGEGVLCLVDPEGAAVGPRQRRLVVRCSAGCCVDYHFPDCWRRVEALLRAARPDYHGLKATKGQSPQPTCWSSGCSGSGVVLSACVMEGPSEQPRYRQQLYTAHQQPHQQQAQLQPQLQQQSQPQQAVAASNVADSGGGRAGGRRARRAKGAAAVSAGDAAASGPADAAAPEEPKAATGRKGGALKKPWQEQSWYGEYEQYDDEEEEEGGAGVDEQQEGDQGPNKDQGEGQERQGGEEEEPKPLRAAEVVDLAAVKLVPLSRRHEGLLGQSPSPEGTAGAGAGGGAGPEVAAATAPASMDDVEAASMVEGGGGGGGRIRKRGGGKVKLTLTDLYKDASEGPGAEGEGERSGPDGGRAGGAPGSGAWKDTTAVPFNVRPVWEREGWDEPPPTPAYDGRGTSARPGAQHASASASAAKGGGGGAGGWTDVHHRHRSHHEGTHTQNHNHTHTHTHTHNYMHSGTANQQQHKTAPGLAAAPAQAALQGRRAGEPPSTAAAVVAAAPTRPAPNAAAAAAAAAARPAKIQMTDAEFPSLVPTAEGTGAAVEAQDDPILRALQLLKVPGSDIATPHLLLEGPCLRHFYTSLFAGRHRIADAQLMSALSRHGAMTAFQSFEDGAAVAASFRNEEVSSAVAAGLGAGDAVGLLGPGSLAGAGGLEVSCLLEFPTDDALAREMLQAERAAGNWAGTGGTGHTAVASKLKPDAAPFVPAGAKAVTAAAMPGSGFGPTPAEAVGKRNSMGPAALPTAPCLAVVPAAAAAPTAHSMLTAAAASRNAPPKPPSPLATVQASGPAPAAPPPAPPPPPAADWWVAPPASHSSGHYWPSGVAVDLSKPLSTSAAAAAATELLGCTASNGIAGGSRFGELPPAAAPTTAAPSAVDPHLSAGDLSISPTLTPEVATHPAAAAAVLQPAPVTTGAAMPITVTSTAAAVSHPAGPLPAADPTISLANFPAASSRALSLLQPVVRPAMPGAAPGVFHQVVPVLAKPPASNGGATAPSTAAPIGPVLPPVLHAAMRPSFPLPAASPGKDAMLPVQVADAATVPRPLPAQAAQPVPVMVGVQAVPIQAIPIAAGLVAGRRFPAAPAPAGGTASLTAPAPLSGAAEPPSATPSRPPVSMLGMPWLALQHSTAPAAAAAPADPAAAKPAATLATHDRAAAGASGPTSVLPQPAAVAAAKPASPQMKPAAVPSPNPARLVPVPVPLPDPAAAVAPVTAATANPAAGSAGAAGNEEEDDSLADLLGLCLG